jgi:cysteine desulfurase / selenocysteine lyase
MTQSNPDNLRDNFPFFINNPEVTYLDSAATSIKLGAVGAVCKDYIDNSGMTIARSTSRLSADLYEKIEKVRVEMLEFFCVGKEKRVYFTGGATDSANQIATMLEENIVWQKRDKIVIAIDNHHANILPYYRMIDNLAELEVDIEWLYLKKAGDNEYEIDYTKLNEICISKNGHKIKAVVLCQSSNVIGNSINWNLLEPTLKLLADSSVVILDGTQSFMHGFKVPEVVDFCFGSGHKMYGCQGVGFTFISKKIIKWVPAKLGGGIVENVSENGVTFYEDGTQFEAGTLNFPAILSLSKCIEFIKNSQWPCLDLSGFARLNNHFKIISSQNKTPKIVSLECLNSSPLDVALYLETLGIVSRAGMHCAQPLHEYLGLKQGTLRFSFAHYTKQDDVNKLLSILDNFLDK